MLALSRLDMAWMVHFLSDDWLLVSADDRVDSMAFSSSRSITSFSSFMNRVKYLRRKRVKRKFTEHEQLRYPHEPPPSQKNN